MIIIIIIISSPARPRVESYPEGNFGGNRLLDGSISLWPLYAVLTVWKVEPKGFWRALPQRAADCPTKGVCVPSNLSATCMRNVYIYIYIYI